MDRNNSSETSFPHYDRDDIGDEPSENFAAEVLPDGTRRYMLINGTDDELLEPTAQPETNNFPVVNRRGFLQKLGSLGIGTVVIFGIPAGAYGAFRMKGLLNPASEEETESDETTSEVEQAPEYDTYFVVPGDTLWDITEENYAWISDTYGNAGIDDFIDRNIQNIDAEEDGRDKEDLWEGDELHIDPHYEPLKDDEDSE